MIVFTPKSWKFWLYCYNPNYCPLMLTEDFKGIKGMRAGWGGYSLREDIWLSRYYLCKSIYHSLWSHSAGFKCFSGRVVWDWHFSLTSLAIKRQLASYRAPTISFLFTTFSPIKILRYGNWAVESHCTGVQAGTLVTSSSDCWEQHPVMGLPFPVVVFLYVFIVPGWKKVYKLVTLLTCMVNMNLTRHAFKTKFLWRFVVPGVYLSLNVSWTISHQSLHLRWCLKLIPHR